MSGTTSAAVVASAATSDTQALADEPAHTIKTIAPEPQPKFADDANTSKSKLIAQAGYQFTEAELAALKAEFASFDTSGDGRCVCDFASVTTHLFF